MRPEDYYNNDDAMDKFVRINEISCYNNNYYVGKNNHLLFAHSDDDDTTEWFIIYNKKFHLLGYSFVSSNDKLVKTNTPWT